MRRKIVLVRLRKIVLVRLNRQIIRTLCEAPAALGVLTQQP